jgi:3-hydroxyisobutyrate dehydrogenase
MAHLESELEEPDLKMDLTSHTRLGFIGTGVMGKSMAGHLLRAGYPLSVYTRTRARAESLIAAGATWCDTAAELARNSEVILTIVGFPADVEQVYFGPAGILAHAARGAVVIDLTTSSPALAQRIHAEAGSCGLAALDAPVSGGDRGAREATLAIMVGGEAETLAAVLPLLQCLGKNIVHQGPAGSGQFTKMANQIAIASGMLGVCEALAYAKKAGLDPTKVLQSIGGGAAGSWSLNNYGPRIIAGDFAPGFFVKHFIKDLGIAVRSAEELGLGTPGLALAKKMYEKLADEGWAESGTHALFKLYDSKT